ncbi:Ig-like domain-containing protein, partial [Neolewinella persica]|uniref:Ig-like domain-containing protein n=1 Tax=Neolewinella persica TaxID=70998 RepID=UPI0005C58B26
MGISFTSASLRNARRLLGVLVVALFFSASVFGQSDAAVVPATPDQKVFTLWEYYVVPEGKVGAKDDYIKFETNGKAGDFIEFRATLNGKPISSRLPVGEDGLAKLSGPELGLYEDVKILNAGRVVGQIEALMVQSRSLGHVGTDRPVAPIGDTDGEYTGPVLEDAPQNKMTGCVNNKLSNRDFESGISGWNVSSSADAYIVTSGTAGEHIYQGNKALKLENAGAWAYQGFDVGANRDYCFSVYAKNHSTAGSFRVGVIFMNSGNTIIGEQWDYVTYNSGYNLYSFDGVTPSGTRRAEIEFYRDNSTNANGWVDLVCFEDKGTVIDGGDPPGSFMANCADGKKVDIYDSDADCNASPQTIVNIPSSSNVYQVVAEVVYKGVNPGVTTSVTVSNGDEYLMEKVNVNNSGNTGFHIYRGLIPQGVSSVFHNAPSGKCSNNTQNNAGLQSLAVYAFRNVTEEVASSGVFTGLTGYNSLASFDIPVPTSYLTRQVTLKIPFSEITMDGRYVTLNAKVDGVVLGSDTWTFTTSNQDGCCIEILEFDVPNVPGDATVITVEVDTRNGMGPGGVNGQSYTVAGLAYADIECPKNGGDCILSFSAKGDCGHEQVQLKLDGVTVATYILSTNFHTYTYNNFTTGSDVELHFVNDGTVSGCDRNVYINNVTVGEETYNTASSATVSNTSCNDLANEALYCNGFFDFGELYCFEPSCPEVIAYCGDAPLTKTLENFFATCNSNPARVFYASGLFSGATASNYWKVIGSSTFEEFNDGAARLQMTVENVSNANLTMTFDVIFNGRTQAAAAGSPKFGVCVSSAVADWYYYTDLAGTVTGSNGLAGFEMTVSPIGSNIQVGTGADLLGPTGFGISGWLDYNILSQPTSGVTASSGAGLDINAKLSSDVSPKFNGEDTCGPVCEDATTTISAQGAGGVEPYTYTWSNSLGNGQVKTVSPDVSTTYTVTITDANGCSDTDQVYIEVYKNFTNGGTIAADQEGCSPYDAHLLTNVTLPSGGTGSGTIEYIWMQNTTGDCTPPTDADLNGWVQIPGSTSSTYDPGTLTQTTCFIRCARYEGCTIYRGESNVVTIEVTDPIIVDVHVTDADCDTNNGTVTANASGGSGNYNYLWSNNATTATIAGLAPGTYTVTVTDASDAACSASDQGTVLLSRAEWDAVQLGSNVDNCAGICNGSIMFDADFGATGEFRIEYTFNGSVVQVPGTFTAAFFITVDGLCAGTYSDITIIGVHTGCSAVWPDDIVISEPEGPTVDAGDDVTICDQDATVLSATATSSQTCSEPGVSDCNHELEAQGGFVEDPTAAAYCGSGIGAKLWTAGNQGTSFVTIDFLEVVPAGTEICVSMKLEHCSNTSAGQSSAKIQASSQPSSGFTNLKSSQTFTSTSYQEYCYTLTAPARYVKVTDNGSCAFRVDYVRFQTVGQATNAITYQWSGPGIVGPANQMSISVNQSGTYTVTVTDCAGECTATDQVEVSLNSLPDPVCESNVNNAGWVIEPDCAVTVCAGDKLVLSVNPNVSTVWSGPNGFSLVGNDALISNAITSAEAGQYTATVTNAEGCSASTTITVTVNSIIASVNDERVCEYEDASFTATVTSPGTFTYLWSNGATSNSIDVVRARLADAGTYSVTITDQTTGCTTVASGELTVIQNFTNGGEIEANQDNCGPLDAATITSVSMPSGGTGTGAPEFIWLKSTGDCTPPTVDDYGDWTPISGATGSSYDPGLVSVTTCYIRCARYPGCELYLGESNVVTITIFDGFEVEVSNSTVCAGEPATLTTTITDGAPAFTYAWSSGESSASITKTPLTTTSYTVTVTDANGCTDVATGTITVKPQPVADITAAPTSICSGETVTFTANSSGTNVGATFTWNFGDNASPATATGAGPHVVTYTLPAAQNGNGTASVALTVARNGCEDTDQQTITIKDRPEVTDVASTNPTCGADNGTVTISFVDNPNRTGIKFSIDGGVTYPYSASDNAGTFTITGLDAGSYDLFAIWGADDCPADIEDVTLTDENGPDVTASNNTSICVGGSVTLSASATGGTGTITYSWNQGAGAGASVVVMPTVTTTYTVTATDANGCTDTDQVMVTVVPDPEVTIVADGSDICEDGVVSITATPSDGLDCDQVRFQGRLAGTTNWGPAGSGTFTQVGPGLAPGVYEYRAIYECDGEGCDDAASDIITVTIFPDPEVTIVLSDDILCIGETATITATPTGGIDCGEVSYEFREGNSGDWTVVSGVTGNTLTTDGALAAGTYQYRAQLVCSGEDCNSDDSNVVTITVKPDPTGTITPKLICDGESATLTVMSPTGDTPFTYNWSNGGGTNQSATFSPSTTTSYNVTITDGNGCSAVLTGTINVTPLPTAEITPLPGNECVGTEYTFTATNAGAGASYSWNFGALATPATATGIGPHTVVYTTADAATINNTTVTLTVIKDDCENEDTEVVNVLPVPTIEVSAGDPTTCEGTDGTLGINVTSVDAGGALVELSIDGGLTYSTCGNEVFTGLSAGSYTIYARYCNDDCPYELETVTLSDPRSPNARINGPEEVCVDASGTSTEAVFTAGNAGANATYEWYFGAGATPQTATGRTPDPVTYATAGTKTVTLTVTRNGCTAGDEFVITVNEAPTVSITPTTICAEEDGTLSASVSGGEAPYTYAWSNGGGNLPSAIYDQVMVTTSYTVTVTDNNGCSTVATGTINVNPLPVPDLSNDLTICDGESTTLSVENVFFGTAPFTYQWWNGNAPATILSTTTELTVGPADLVEGVNNFFVRVTDANGCFERDVVMVTVVPKPTVTTNDPTICFGETATLTAVAGGGNGTFAYEWSTGANTASIDVTPNTTTDYTVTVTSTYTTTGNVNTNCTAEATSTVTVTPLPVAEINGDTPVCSEESLTFTATDAGTGASYVWNFGNNASPATATGAGPHNVTYTLPANPAGNGTATVSLTVTKDNCVETDEATITIYDLPEATVASTNPTCGDDNGTITVTFPDNPSRTGIEFSINGAAGPYVQVNDNSGSYTFTALDAGSYDLYTRWGNEECPVDLEDVTLNDENAPSVEASDDKTICVGGSVTLTALATGGTGTISYSWDNGAGAGASVVVTPGITTVYTVTVSDANGCEATDMVTITVVPDPQVTIVADGTDICEDGVVSITATPSDGLDCEQVRFQGRLAGTTNWGTAGSGTFTQIGPGLAPGVYEYRAVYECAGEGCDDAASDIITVTITPDPEVTIALDDDVLCLGETATFTATVSGGLDCENVTWHLRSGAQAYQQVATGNTYSIPTNLAAGTYTVRAEYVCGGEGCDDDTSNEVSFTVKPDPIANVDDVTICDGESGTLTVTTSVGDAPFTYVWSNSGGTANTATYGPLSATTSYTVIVTDANGCVTEATGTINVTPLPVAAITPLPGNECDGSEYEFVATDAGAGAVYTWNFGTGASPATATGIGPHTVVYTTPNASTDINTTVTLTVVKDDCENTDTEDVSVLAEPEVTVTATADPTTCGGDQGSITVSVTKPAGSSVEISLDGGATYETCNQTTFSGLTAGTYAITVRYCNDDCPYEIETVTLSDPLSPTAEINGPAEICVDDSETITEAVFTATNAGLLATYSWNFGAGATPQTATGRTPGPVTYATTGDKTVNLTVTRLGCSDSDAFTITVNEAPTVSINPVTICAEEDGTLSASVSGGEAPYTYAWSNGGGNMASATYETVMVTTDYTVTVTDANGCSTVATGTINVNPLPVPDLSNDLTICDGESTTLVVENVFFGTAPFTYQWWNATDPGTILSTTTELTVGPADLVQGLNNFFVRVTDANGCFERDVVMVTVAPNPVVTVDPETICFGETATLMAQASGGNGTFAYKWSANAGGATTASIDVTPAVTTTYSVTVTSTYTYPVGGVANCTDETSVTVTVNENPVVEITDTDDNNTTCSGEEVTLTANTTLGTGPYTIEWTVDNDPMIVSSDVQLVVTPTETTTYRVKVTDANGCMDTDEITITVDPTACARLGDYVWEDTNGNGINDEPASAGVDGVTVNLKDATGTVINTTTTMNGGLYEFTNLVPGDYSVQFVQPAGFEFTQDGAIGSNEINDSDAVESANPAMDGMTEVVNLEEGENYPDLDAGIYRPASLGDFVWLDTNADGIQDGGELGIP